MRWFALALWCLAAVAAAPPRAFEDNNEEAPDTHVADTQSRRALSPFTAGQLDPPRLAAPRVTNPPRRADGKAMTCPVRGVVDIETGQILYGANLTKRMFPASTTKVMTALLAMEDIEAGRARLKDVVRVSKAAAHTSESGLWLAENERITLHDLLVGVMVRSANDASRAVAELLGPGPEAFVERMNRRAKELGCVDTHFINPHGLHMDLDGHREAGENHYTTGYDLLRIAMAAWRHPFFQQLCLMDGEPVSWENLDPEQPHPDKRVIRNRNKLLHRYPECVGIKTGFTKQAGACLISAARRGDRAVMAVTMKSASGGDRWAESEALLRWGLDEFCRTAVLTADRAVGQLRLDGGREASVPVVPTRSLTLVLPRAAGQPVIRTQMDDHLPAPISVGLPVGWVAVELPGGAARRVALVAQRSVPTVHATGRSGALVVSALLAMMGVFGYGAATEAHCRRGRVLTSRGRGADPAGTSDAERPTGHATGHQGRPG